MTLNTVDPAALKSTDSLEPGLGRRQRTQIPIASDLTLFDFDKDSTILSRLTGKVKEKYRKFFKHATGASNLRVSTNLQSNQLAELCKELLSIYASEEYKSTFPDLQSVAPVKDPEKILELNQKLISAFREKEGVELVMPDLIDYGRSVEYAFSGLGKSLVYDDLFIGRYYEYLDEHNKKLDQMNLFELKKHNINILDENGTIIDQEPVFKCMLFDTKLEEGNVYHLSSGSWYKVERSFISKLKKELDELYEDTKLPPFNHKTEGKYNSAVAKNKSRYICLDRTSIAPAGQKAVEPCDLYSVSNGRAVLDHVKISTMSNALSHLFNQGTNSIELIIAEQNSEKRFRKLIEERADKKAGSFLKPLDDRKYKVAYQIITHKDPAKKSENLPLFSRISMRRHMKALRLMQVERSYGFIKDTSPRKPGKAKKRKVGEEVGARVRRRT